MANRTNRENRELFERDVFIKGRHGYYNKQLQATGLFSTNHEVAEIGIMLGLLFEQQENEDTDSEEMFRSTTYDCKIGKETMRDSGQMIRDLYRHCMLQHDSYINIDERMERAFGYDYKGEDAVSYEEILLTYMRGGISILYEKIIEGGVPRAKKEFGDYVRNEYRLLEYVETEMKQKYDKKKGVQPMSTEDILKHA